MVVQSPTIQPYAGKRKGISRNVDLGSLPSHQHLKKVRIDKAPSKTPSSKAPKSKDATAYLENLAVNLVLSEVPPSAIQTKTFHPFVGRHSRKTHPSTLVEASPTLVLDEGHAFSLLIFFFKRKFRTFPRPSLCQAMVKFYAAS